MVLTDKIYKEETLMDNVFFAFLETYWADISAFVTALKDFVTALIGKLGGTDAE